MKYVTRVRPATVFPFILGVFSGTLITVFLFLSVRSIEELEAEPPGVEAREGRARANANTKPSARDHERDSQALGTLDNTRKKIVFHRRKAVSYNVLTHSMQGDSRGIAIHKTWASETKLKNHVNFYLLSPVQTEEGTLKKKLHITPLVMKEGDTIYGDNYQGIFDLWRDICERKLNDYHWFVRLKDTVYLKADKLEKLLTSLNSSEPILVGRSVTPAGYERNSLGLRVGESYCFEGGYALSWKALDLVCPHLSACKEGAKSENEDVEMARCIRSYAGINCTASTEMKELFYVAEGIIAEEELQMGAYQLNPSVKQAILLSSLREPDHFYHLHQYLMREKLNSTKITTNQLRTVMIKTAKRAAQLDNLLYTSEHQSPPWTRLGINPPFSSRNPDDGILHFQSFDDQYKYTESKHHPSTPLNGTTKREMSEVVAAVTKFQAQKTQSIDSENRETALGGEKLVVESILQRVDPSRGIDYFLQLADLDKNKSSHLTIKSEFYHALREIEPPRVVSMNSPNCGSIKVNFVVATPPVSRGFQRFMLSFENSFLARNPPELVSLLVVLYSDGKFKKYDKDLFSVVTLLDLYKKKYPKGDLRLITTRNSYSRKETIEIASKEYPTYELLFLADIHIDFSMQFIERCRMNAVENGQVYFPMVFSPYDPVEFHKSRIKFPYATKFKIGENMGAWIPESYHLVCVFNYDLIKVLNRNQNGEGSEKNWNLLNEFIKYDQLRIFRAVEPGLVHLWQDGCKEEELGSKKRTLCQQLKLIDDIE